MGTNSAIEWTDHTFNPWWGCYQLADSPACDNCYARGIATRFHPAEVEWTRLGNRLAPSERYWKKPLGWNARAKKEGRRQRVFCLSMGDFFEKHPDVWEARRRTFKLMHATPHLQWLVLTKRPENWPEISPPNGALPDNVSVGVTAENQATADERIPQLLQIPAAVRFVSCEPLLGPVDLRKVPRPDDAYFTWRGEKGAITDPNEPDDYVYWQKREALRWVIAGGESGPGARPSHPDWFRSLRDQCQAADVPFFFKQWGAWALIDSKDARGDDEECLFSAIRQQNGMDHGFRMPDDVLMRRVGKKAAGRQLDGRTWDQFPEVE